MRFLKNKKMKRIFAMLMTGTVIIFMHMIWQPHRTDRFYGKYIVENIKKPEKMYSLAYCMIDADNGRALLEKDADVMYPMASTTKIMTCILALEYGNLDSLVTVSPYAASMPDVQLNIRADEKYILKDLLYSLMLESHNDSAVAIAEHISGSVGEFAKLMNEKAMEIGCTNYNFVTPNGLDGTSKNEITGEEVPHSISARDLSLIMAYCIKNREFLDITTTFSHSFNNKVEKDGSIVNGKRSFTVSNRNALLTGMEGVLSGKTGYTGKAGYCYVCAVERDGRKYAVALLGAGWPPNKNYKWQDVKKLLDYGISNYDRQTIIVPEENYKALKVRGGTTDTIGTYTDKTVTLLMSGDDRAEFKEIINAQLTAPVYPGQIVGAIEIYINGVLYDVAPVKSKGGVKATDLKYWVKRVLKGFLL